MIVTLYCTLGTAAMTSSLVAGVYCTAAGTGRRESELLASLLIVLATLDLALVFIGAALLESGY